MQKVKFPVRVWGKKATDEERELYMTSDSNVWRIKEYAEVIQDAIDR
jgi:hypothetical protein